MSFADREPLRKQFPSGPYSNLRLVVVNGAEAGDALECRMLLARPIDWGCVRISIDWLNVHGGMDRRDAYALCSMAVSFRMTQWANQTGSVYSSTPPRTIHAVIPKQVLGEQVGRRIEAPMRPAR